MQFAPEYGHIVVVKTGRAAQSSGAHGAPIVLPDGAQKESETAIVAAVSADWIDEGGTARTSKYKPLDACLVSKYAGETFTMRVQGRDQTFTVMKESSVLCRLIDFIPADGGPLPDISRIAPPTTAQLGGTDGQLFDIQNVAPSGAVPEDDPANREMSPEEADEFRAAMAGVR